MTQLIYIAGSGKKVGKTFLTLGLRKSLSRKTSVGLFKPVAVGQMDHYAADLPTDGERFVEFAQHQETVNLINPYILNEDLPPHLAAQRDGLKIDLKVLNERIALLKQFYPLILIEGTGGLLLPFSESFNELDLLKQWQPKIIWVCGVGEQELSQCLAQVKLMQREGLQILGIVLNNKERVRHLDLIRFQWLTLENNLKIPVLGLLPQVVSGLEDELAIEGACDENLSQSLYPLLRD